MIRNVRLLDASSRRGISDPVNIRISDGRISQITAAVSAAACGGGSAEAGAPGGSSAGGAREGEPEIDGSGMLALPGLVNAHFHSSGTFNRGLIRPLPLELFMLYELPPFDFGPFGAELYRVQALLAGTRMMRSGVTTVMDDLIVYPVADLGSLDAVMSAYEDLGLRATVAPYQPNKVEYDWYPYLRELLPDDVVRRMDMDPPPATGDLLAMFGQFVEQWHGRADGRLRCAVSCSAPQRSTDEYMVGLHELARRHGLAFNIHVYESKLQRVAAHQLYGRSAIAHMRSLGVLDELTAVVHAVWVDEDDIADLAAAGSSIVHSPSGNMRCGSGMFPFRQALRAGVPVALCTDEATVEEHCNLWRVGQLAATVHTLDHPDHRQWPSPGEIINAMTRSGAAAVRLPDEIGELAAGKRADIVLLDLSSDTFFPLTNALNQLVYGEDGRSVKAVLVDGRKVVEDGRVLTVDEAAVRADAGRMIEEWMDALLPAAHWAERLAPMFEAVYLRCAAEDVGVNRWIGDEGRWLADGDWQTDWQSRVDAARRFVRPAYEQRSGS